MLKRSLVAACAVAALAAPCASAADTTVAPDAKASGTMTALDGTIVWVSGKFGAETLMQRTAAGTARVPGAPTAKDYPSIDLGHDSHGALVLTYLRCRGSKCTALRDDLHGHRASIRGLTPPHCSLSTAPALWGTRIAYGLDCHDRPLGLWVKRGSAPADRLPRPHDAVRFGSRAITAVDLRGTWVGAVAADVYEYAFSERVSGAHQEYFLAAASEGDSDEHVAGLAVGPGGVLWTLVDAEHVGDPNQAVISRLVPRKCIESEVVANPAGPNEQDGYRATGLAVDGATLFLTAPGIGIVSHPFTAARPCPPT
ncbi:MAG: repeat-containing protein [Solirubrobacterales bacterium]|nr:repeat-containing protein [Solirubrobacterales bacterium]